MMLDKDQVFEQVKVDGLEGDWLHFGKNELGSEVYLRIDNITRIPTSNVNICYFERMLSNNNGLNNEGDKSTVIRRFIDFNRKRFKDIEFTIFKQEMCKGPSDNIEFDVNTEGVWSEWEKDSWDEFFAGLLEETNPSFSGVNLPNSSGRLNNSDSSTNTQKTERDLHELSRKADWIAIKWVVFGGLILFALFGLVVGLVDF